MAEAHGDYRNHGGYTHNQNTGWSVLGSLGYVPTPRPRAYKCPRCRGEFDSWNKKKCPFCGLKQFEFIHVSQSQGDGD